MTVATEENWSIRISAQRRPSDGAAVASVEFDESMFTHLPSAERNSAALALIKAAEYLLASNAKGEDYNVLIVPYKG